MGSHVLVAVARWYVALDFVLGPLAVLSCLAGYTAFLLGLFASWGGWVSWVVAMPLVGLVWAGLGTGYYRVGRRVVRWARG
jgi:hypothetical protein